MPHPPKRPRRGLSRGISIISIISLAGVLALASRAERKLEASPPAAGPAAYRSPQDLAFSPDGRLIAVADRTAGVLAILNAADGELLRDAKLSGKLGGVVFSPDGSRIFVAEYEGGAVGEVNVADASVAGRMALGARPQGLAIAPKRNLLLSANSALADVSVIDLSKRQEQARIKVLREPFSIAVTPDESMAVVSNLLPAGSATDPGITAAVSLIDLEKLERIADIPLPPNSTCTRGVAISPDGGWAYIVHTVGRSNLPATQLDRGWVNTNALSLIDLNARQHHATLLLDSLSEGAADPWGLAVAPDGKTLWITLAGTHQLARVDLAGLHELLEGKSARNAEWQKGASGGNPAYSPAVIWDQIRADPSRRSELVNDLSALYIARLIERQPLPGRSPRGIAISPDGERLAVALYFGGDVAMVDVSDSRIMSRTPLGAQPQPDEVRRGEMIFNDAHYVFQRWLSCATCHPNEGRVDGLNWDLPNDGLGNPKNNKSLLYAHLTPPAMWLGVRQDMETAAAAGFRFAQQAAPEEDVRAVQAYLRSLTPEPSPYRNADGSLSERAMRGKAIFESEKTHCTHCHSGPQYTNLKRYNVGTQGPLDHAEEMYFDTPALVELWRTAPYLHDGRAATLAELFIRHNTADRHGSTSHLSQEEIDDLAEYLLSLP